jgi:hypothetical protein
MAAVYFDGKYLGEESDFAAVAPIFEQLRQTDLSGLGFLGQGVSGTPPTPGGGSTGGGTGGSGGDDGGGTVTSPVDPNAALLTYYRERDAMARADLRRNAIESVKAAFAAAGLDDAFVNAITADIQNIVNEGFTDAAVISARLRGTETYKKRFVGNEARKAKGLSVLSPAEYLGLEREYRQVMSSAGISPIYFDSTEDYTRLIENDISVNELGARVGLAQQVVQATDPTVRETMREFYNLGDGDLVAYYLDPEKAKPLLQRQTNVATVGGALRGAGFTTDVERAQRLAEGAAGTLSTVAVDQQQAQARAQAAAAQKALTQQVVGGEQTAVTEEALLESEFLQTAESRRAVARERETRLAEYGRGGSLAATQEGIVGLRRAQR